MILTPKNRCICHHFSDMSCRTYWFPNCTFIFYYWCSISVP